MLETVVLVQKLCETGKHDGWRIGGYQADFEAGDKFTESAMVRRFAVLSMRGDKTHLL